MENNLKKTIPEILHEQILIWNSEGKSTSQISKLLKEEHNITVSTSLVQKTCKSLKEQRAELLEGVLAKKLKENIGQDLSTLRKQVSSLSNLFVKYMGKERLASNDTEAIKFANMALKISKSLESWISLSFDVSGIKKSEPQTTSNINFDFDLIKTDIQNVLLEKKPN